jgi:hypothetical protein
LISSRSVSDVIAKEEWIDVLVAKGGRTRQTVLLEYVPAAEALPVVKLVAPNAFKISVPRISSLHLRRDRWENLSSHPLRSDDVCRSHRRA